MPLGIPQSSCRNSRIQPYAQPCKQQLVEIAKANSKNVKLLILDEDRIIRSMVGREIVDRYPSRQSSIAGEVFRVEGLTTYDPLNDRRAIVKDVSFSLNRGIDVGAKYEIYTLINKPAAEGKAILMISLKLPELLGMCDRIYVVTEGEIAGELPRSDATQESIMK